MDKKLNIFDRKVRFRKHFGSPIKLKSDDISGLELGATYTQNENSIRMYFK
jgi:hypothetical protein